jgi:hypothetical protein
VKTLSADEVAFTLAPNRLAIKEVRVLEPGAKVAISKDGEVNLAQVLGPDARRANGPAASDRKERAAATISRRAPEESAGDAFTADIGRFRVRNGTVDFSDRSLALPFSARVRRFNGSAVGISTDRASRAELKFEGRIEGSGSAKVEGGLNAFDPRAFTDVRVEFDNVEMPPLSPYAATFAGRKIASGRLWLDLRYKIVKSELAGENKIVMQDFTLGERVEAPNALDLPLDLAVTLLTDSQGRINVAVPVRGNIDNPQFSYRHLIREALASLIVRIVSAPFRALAGVFGSGAETLGSINFEPGRARLLPPEQEKLDRVVQALKDKPQVKLIVRGPYDPQLDGEALRNRQVRREVAQALGVKLEQREDPGPIAYSDAATQRALETMLAARTGPKAAAELEREFKKNAGRDPERVSRLLALFGKASPDREFYQALFQRLVESYPLPETELQRSPRAERRPSPSTWSSPPDSTPVAWKPEMPAPPAHRIRPSLRSSRLGSSRAYRPRRAAFPQHRLGVPHVVVATLLPLIRPGLTPSPGHADCWRHGALGFGRAVAFAAPEKREGKSRSRQDQPPGPSRPYSTL